MKTRLLRQKTATHAILIVLGLSFVAPFLWMLLTSIKSLEEITSLPVTIWPEIFRWRNYADVFDVIPFTRYFWNTLLITGLSVIGQLISAPLVAYAITKIEWFGAKWIFPIVIGTMLLPYQVTMIPVYLIFQKLHLTGSIWPLVIPTFTAAPLYIFLLRQFFMGLPTSLIHAAKIDGANDYRIYWSVVLPLTRPALASVAIFTFLYTWSDFMGPLLYINKAKQYTLTLGLQAFLAEHYTEWGLLMAASALFTLPIVVVFFFAQKQFVEGISLTGIKG
ncbi:carbohydrate ABC transporter membrane protein 2, CUT1 family (TC 3.A.1.1.-) [Cohnella sp. OV330]|uniref:carbohydrate ABC transporter permease n=1 Tax=Cohnella sp. OV330 TaxID=1855288 RepID=UPI0008EBEC1D|nr:carbohydrate ABC transporter permease [Cohnella sp. OV330]SFB59505.1 carbohydrate ABC transporter membrane protein 2, CUT1 family (TC 3.A.1.1.-) [Cohnella sp. OV330]